MKNKNFIYGVIFGFVLIPILDELTNLIVSLFELPKATITKKILKENKIIADIQTDTEKVDDAVAIGFHYTPTDEDWDDED
ncbi:MAG TPA: hypothetical protein VJ083_06830 [Sedimentibacter sp.]|nr:hypothetical protein [Sedimentibacter sp.]